ncbi:MAG TPA: hypothetical protein VFT41_11900 [Gemmatimonadaceae bacterium]|nr:hypothetical protein [Gemmatimonadaceae bacterium]
MPLLRPSLVAVPFIAFAASCTSQPDVTGTNQPPPGSPHAVIVVPSSLNLLLGDSVQLAAFVEDSVGSTNTSQSVTWSVDPSDSPIHVSATGYVHACYPGGTAHVIATSVAAPTISGTSTVLAASTLLSPVNLWAIQDSATGAAANLNALAGTVNVLATVSQHPVPCYAVTEADLVIHRQAGDTIVARVPLDTTATDTRTITLPFQTAAAVNGAPAFPNGDYAIRVIAVISGPNAPAPSSTINVSVKN